MYLNLAEIMAKAGLQGSASGIGERLSWSAENVFHDRWRFQTSILTYRLTLKGKSVHSAFGTLSFWLTSASAFATGLRSCWDRKRLLKKARQGTISQGLLKSADGNSSQQHLPGEVLVGGFSG